MKASRLVAILVALLLAAAGGFLLGERTAVPLEPPTKTARDVAPSESSRRAVSARVDQPRSARAPIAPSPAPVPPTPLPALDVPVAGILDDLKKQAAAGNARAACRLAFELERCRGVPRLQRSATSYASLAGQPGVGPELTRRYGTIAEREQARVNEAQRLCAGVPMEEGGEAWRYLLQAARAGHGPSMARYAGRRTLWDEDPMRVLDGLIAFRTEGPAFLQGAAQLGYPEAYEQLAFAQVGGASLGLDIPVDRIRGIAYYLALMRVGTPDEAARFQRAVDDAMRKENLSQEDLSRARSISEPLAATLLRRNPPGSVDLAAASLAGDNGSHCEK